MNTFEALLELLEKYWALIVAAAFLFTEIVIRLKYLRMRSKAITEKIKQQHIAETILGIDAKRSGDFKLFSVESEALKQDVAIVKETLNIFAEAVLNAEANKVQREYFIKRKEEIERMKFLPEMIEATQVVIEATPEVQATIRNKIKKLKKQKGGEK